MSISLCYHHSTVWWPGWPWCRLWLHVIEGTEKTCSGERPCRQPSRWTAQGNLCF